MNIRDSDTDIGGQAAGFPETRFSVLQLLQKSERAVQHAALETLIQLYWKPVYKHLRIKWRKSNEDAKDLTQAFFLQVLEKDFFKSYDPSKSRFRTYLRICLDGFASNVEKSGRAMKRGGDAHFVSLDVPQAEWELSQTSPSPDECFDREWTRSIFTSALEQFSALCHQTGRTTQLRLFELYDVDPDPDAKLSYASLAARFGIAVTDITNYLAWARSEFRKCVLLKLREITGSEEEFRSEARRLLGAKIP